MRISALSTEAAAADDHIVAPKFKILAVKGELEGAKAPGIAASDQGPLCSGEHFVQNYPNQQKNICLTVGRLVK